MKEFCVKVDGHAVECKVTAVPAWQTAALNESTQLCVIDGKNDTRLPRHCVQCDKTPSGYLAITFAAYINHHETFYKCASCPLDVSKICTPYPEDVRVSETVFASLSTKDDKPVKVTFDFTIGAFENAPLQDASTAASVHISNSHQDSVVKAISKAAAGGPTMQSDALALKRTAEERRNMTATLASECAGDRASLKDKQLFCQMSKELCFEINSTNIDNTQNDPAHKLTLDVTQIAGLCNKIQRLRAPILVDEMTINACVSAVANLMKKYPHYVHANDANMGDFLNTLIARGKRDIIADEFVTVLNTNVAAGTIYTGDPRITGLCKDPEKTLYTVATDCRGETQNYFGGNNVVTLAAATGDSTDGLVNQAKRDCEDCGMHAFNKVNALKSGVSAEHVRNIVQQSPHVNSSDVSEIVQVVTTVADCLKQQCHDGNKQQALTILFARGASQDQVKSGTDMFSIPTTASEHFDSIRNKLNSGLVSGHCIMSNITSRPLLRGKRDGMEWCVRQLCECEPHEGTAVTQIKQDADIMQGTFRIFSSNKTVDHRLQTINNKTMSGEEATQYLDSIRAQAVNKHTTNKTSAVRCIPLSSSKSFYQNLVSFSPGGQLYTTERCIGPPRTHGDRLGTGTAGDVALGQIFPTVTGPAFWAADPKTTLKKNALMVEVFLSEAEDQALQRMAESVVSMWPDSSYSSKLGYPVLSKEHHSERLGHKKVESCNTVLGRSQGSVFVQGCLKQGVSDWKDEENARSELCAHVNAMSVTNVESGFILNWNSKGFWDR